ncbi:MAG: right-handed parallel beta-helix repeat-containing protein [Dysgonamonadaceae bacterium]
MIKVIKKNSSSIILLFFLLIPLLAHSQGSRYTGTYKKSGPIELVNKSNIVIEGLEFEDSIKRSITLWSCSNITIKNCKFKNVKTNHAIMAENSTNISVIDCSFEDVYAAFQGDKCKGNIKFEHNDVKNVIGDLYISRRDVQAAQLRQCNGPGNSISYNVIENIEGESSPDDNINLFGSNGTPESPIRIANNWIRGGGPSLSGGGIMLADYGGSYQIAENNIVVNPGQYGMAIAGGQNITIKNNKIYSKRRPVTNVGLYANNWTEALSGKSYNITVENNDINWTHRDGYLHNSWFSENMKPIKGLETNKYNSNLNESILPDVIINRAGNTEIEDENPDENQPTPPESRLTQVYLDRFNSIAIKYLVSPIPLAFAEAYTSNGQLLIAMTLPRYNQSFPFSAPKGEYYVKITYSELGKTEITKITVN